jgi:hypothetical protein
VIGRIKDIEEKIELSDRGDNSNIANAESLSIGSCMPGPGAQRGNPLFFVTR